MKKIIYCVLFIVMIMNFSGLICSAETLLTYYDTVEIINLPDLIINSGALPEIPEIPEINNETPMNNSFGLKTIIRNSANTFFRK